MDENKKTIIEKRINKTGENLRKNNMEFYYAKTKDDVCPIVESLIKEGDVITNGGTVTLEKDVTVSTNLFVRWFANKPLFYGGIGGGVAVLGGLGALAALKKKKRVAVTK